MKKSYAILIAILLILPMLTVAAPVRASSGHPQFGTTDSGILTLATENITLKAGSMDVSMIDGVPATGNFSIVLTYNSTSRVIFSGAGFDLYMSKDYYSVISPDDKMYASGFNVNDLNLTGLKQVNITNPLLKDGKASFYIGTVALPVPAQVVIGPIPFGITSDYKYIKVFDGSSGSVAVAGIIEILPAFTLTPDSGAPCTSVTLNGVALAPNTVYNITYGNLEDNEFIGQTTSTADGKLNFTWNIIDRNSTDYVGDVDYIGVHVIDNSTGIEQGTGYHYNVAVFSEDQSYFTGITVDGNVVNTDFLNNTGPYNVYVFSDVVLNGSYWCVSCGHVTIAVDGTTLATPTLNSDGNFTAHFVIPELTMGNHVVKVSDCGKTWMFNITVQPTLVVTPKIGPVNTVITLTAYGFDPSNVYFLLWEGLCYNTGDTMSVGIANATVGADGKFNMTTPVTFTVPSSYGGYHDVEAWININWTAVAAAGYNATLFPDWVIGYSGPGDGNFYTAAVDGFFVTPTLWVTPSTFAANGSTFLISGGGLIPGVPYSINVDNQAFAAPNFYSYTYGYDFLGYSGNNMVQFADNVVWADDCGNLVIQLVSAGFYPGWHSVSVSTWSTMGSGTYGNYTLDAYATWKVTAEGDLVVAAINSTTAAQLQAMGAQITSIQNDIATITTNTNTIQVAVSALDAKVTALQGSVATVSTNLGTLTGTVTSIQGNVATIQTTVGQIKANTDSIKGFLPVDLTPVWIAVILSLIAAIASIYGIIVIRSKIAA